MIHYFEGFKAMLYNSMTKQDSKQGFLGGDDNFCRK